MNQAPRAKIIPGILFLAFLALALAGTAAWAAERPCGMGGNNRENRDLARCLSRQPGIRVDRATAVRIGNCESGFNAKAHGHPYHSIYQLLHDEFRVFWHQGPKWVRQEVRRYDYGIHSARGNILATFSHVHDHGWGFIGVCG